MSSSLYKRQMKGFTLIELLIAISLAVVVLSYGVPSFSSFFKNGRITTITNNLVTDINYARSEAVTRGKPVVLCRSDNPTASNPSCGGTNNTWTTGWLVFVSGDGNNSFDVGNDILLRATSKAPGTVSVRSNTVSNTNLTYKADGAIDSPGGTAIFAICDDRGSSYGNQLQISPTGRPRLITPVPVDCNNPGV